MSQPSQTRPAFVSGGSWTASRLLALIAAACEFIAALTVAGAWRLGPTMAWVFGGLAAFFLAGAL